MYFKQEFNCMEKILEIITDCLNPLPTTRPSLDSIISRLESLCIEENSVEFLEVLKNHQSALELKEHFLDPLKEAFRTSSSEKTEKLIDIYESTIWKSMNSGQIKDIYSQPKYYPWPFSLKFDTLASDTDGFASEN